MNLEQTGIIMDILRTAYPRFYSGPKAPDMRQTLQLWNELFKDDDAALVAAAVKSYIVTDIEGYPPHIGAIKAAMYQLTSAGDLDEQEAWELVRRAASRSGWGAQEEYDKLPEAVRKMTSPGQLYEWSQMDSDAFNSVVASNFRRSWRVRQESRRRDALLPAEVRRAITGAARRMALEDGKREVLG